MNREKIGRNQPCWCGSKVKYKKCHLDRENQVPVQAWEIDKQAQERRLKGFCIHPEKDSLKICDAKAIGSHTISKSMLKLISEDGHVYYHSATIQDLVKTNGKLKTKLIGIGRASILPLFCHKHDSGSFEPIEQSPFTGNSEHCFLLAYRAVCLEYAKKKAVYDNLSSMRKNLDRGKSLFEQYEAQQSFADFELGVTAGMKDITEVKNEFDSLVVKKEYAPIRAFIVNFETTPDVLCAGACLPRYDFLGNELQDLSQLSKRMDLMTFSLIGNIDSGTFVFAWHQNSDRHCKAFAQSLDSLTDDVLPYAILRFIFASCENLYFRPQWWENIDNKTKNILTGYLEESTSPIKGYDKTYLLDDGVRAINWKVKSRQWL